jgi:hypothetical protein
LEGSARGKRAAAHDPQRLKARREARVSPGFLFAGGEIFTTESAKAASSAISAVEDFFMKEGKYEGPAFGFKATV